MISEAIIQDPMSGGADAASNSMNMPNKYKIKRVGARPLHFQGSELAMAMSFTPTQPYWYEINIYRSTENRFVLAVRLFYQSDAEQDTARAWDLASFGEVMDTLERYDAAADVKVRVRADDPALSPAEMAAFALSLRAEAETARQQFRGLVGEILHELEDS